MPTRCGYGVFCSLHVTIGHTLLPLSVYFSRHPLPRSPLPSFFLLFHLVLAVRALLAYGEALRGPLPRIWLAFLPLGQVIANLAAISQRWKGPSQ